MQSMNADKKNLKNSVFDYKLKLKIFFLRLIDPQSKTLMRVDECRLISQKNSIFVYKSQSKTLILRLINPRASSVMTILNCHLPDSRQMKTLVTVDER